MLIKTHKIASCDLQNMDATKISCRLIISGCNGVADRVSWLLNFILTSLLDVIPTHLKNTKHLLDELCKVEISLNNTYMESFDVTSLYTNIDNIAATRCVIKLLKSKCKSINSYNLKMCDMKQLLNVCLSCSIFKFNNTYYHQKRGLAIGNRLAPILIIA